MFLTQGQLYMFLTPELQGSGKTSDTAWECKFLWLHDGPGGPKVVLRWPHQHLLILSPLGEIASHPIGWLRNAV